MRQLKDLGLIIAYELHGFRYYTTFGVPKKIKVETSYEKSSMN